MRVIHQGQCPNSISLQGLESRANVTNPNVNTSCLQTHLYEAGVLKKYHYDLIILSDFGGNFPLYVPEAKVYAQRIKKYTKNLVIVARNPDYPDLGVCLNRDLTNLDNCAGSRATDDSDLIVANAVGAGLLRPTDFLCSLGKCPAVIGDFAVNSHGHISGDQSYFSGLIFGALIKNLAPSAF